MVGIKDNLEIVGINETDVFALQDKITSIIFDRCHPVILPEIYTVNLEGKLVLVIEVFRGNLLPYYLKTEGKNKGTYIRVSASNRKADQDHIIELERQKRHQSFDEEPCFDRELKSLDLKPLISRFKSIGKKLNEEKLRNLQLIKREQSKDYPTQGLLILLGQHLHVAIKCARFKGSNMSVFLDRKEYTGDLVTQLEQAEGFIKNHINLRGEINGLKRTDTYEIPETALREALINAIIHRDYTNQGRDIKVGVYDEFIKITSPGGFPSSLTVENLLDGRSEIRNKVVARVFKELGYIEQWGSGIQRIKIACLNHGLREAQIQEKGDFVDTIFYRPIKADLPDFVPDTGKKVANIGELMPDTAKLVPNNGELMPDTAKLVPDTSMETNNNLSENITISQEQSVLNYLKKNQNLTVKVVEELLEVKGRRARVILSEMAKKGLIEKHGKARSTFYKRVAKK